MIQDLIIQIFHELCVIIRVFLLPGYAVAVNTPLGRGVQIAPARWDEKTLRYFRALLLRSLDHPDFAPLREEPEFQAIRARAEAITGEG